MSISVAPRATAAVQQRDAAAQVEQKLDTLRFLPHWAQRGQKLRDELLIMFSELIAPRLAQATRPLLVVIAGSTGAGKSTLLNSILGTEVTKAGVLRPTTRRPILLHHPADENPAGPALAGEVELRSAPEVPRGLALIDSPDIDSILKENRDRALKVLSGADLWLFVTTPTRYGDAVPWEVLEQAAERDAAIAVVLNRTSAEEKRDVRLDLARRLREAKLGTAPLFVIPDAGAHHGLLDSEAVEPLRRWLWALAGSSHARIVEQRSLRGALASVSQPLTELEDLLYDQDQALKDLARRGAEAEDQVRDRAKRPWAEIEPAASNLADAWRAHNGTWHLLNVSSGERLKIRRKDRAAVTAALKEVAEAITKELKNLAHNQYKLLNGAILEAVSEVELEEEWTQAAQEPDVKSAHFDDWKTTVDETAAEWERDRSEKLRRAQTRALGTGHTAILLQAGAMGIRGARALVGTVFGEPGVETATTLGEKLQTVQSEITDQVVDAVQNQLVPLLPMRKSGQQLAKATRRLQEVR